MVPYSAVQLETVANLAYLYSKMPILRPYSAIQLEMAGNLSYLYSKIEFLRSYSAVLLEMASNLNYLHSKIAILRFVKCCLIGNGRKFDLFIWQTRNFTFLQCFANWKWSQI